MKQESTTLPERQSHIERWRASGLSQNEYCRQQGLNASTFCTWRKQLEKRSIAEVPLMEWIRLDAQPQPDHGSRLEIRLNLGIFRLDYSRIG